MTISRTNGWKRSRRKAHRQPTAPTETYNEETEPLGGHGQQHQRQQEATRPPTTGSTHQRAGSKDQEEEDTGNAQQTFCH